MTIIRDEVTLEFDPELVHASDDRDGHHGSGRRRIGVALSPSPVCTTYSVGRGASQVCDTADRVVAGPIADGDHRLVQPFC